MLIGNYSAKYIGKTMCGFVNGYDYHINITKDLYGYVISGTYDLSEDDYSSACINYASENSIRRNWVIKEDLTEVEGCLLD